MMMVDDDFSCLRIAAVALALVVIYEKKICICLCFW